MELSILKPIAKTDSIETADQWVQILKRLSSSSEATVIEIGEKLYRYLLVGNQTDDRNYLTVLKESERYSKKG